MMHVPPHRWADVLAGRVDDAERAELEHHAASCAKCKRSRARVMRASDSFIAIRNQSAPELGWDAVRAKVHWTVSTERRAKVPRPAPRFAWPAVGALAAAGLVAALVVPRSEPEAVVRVEPALQQHAPTRVVIPPAPSELVGLVNRTTGDIMLDGIRPKETDLFARKLTAGTMIATAGSEIDVQFGQGSAFRLGPRSTLHLRRFDSEAIELVIEGRLDLQVAPRANGQRFVVHAGDRAIEVRGTQFRVEHVAGATAVACRHGLVQVRDRHGAVDVAAERRLALVHDRRVVDERAAAMTTDELGVLADATPMVLPVWDLVALATSAPLEIATPGRPDVRLDGIELGAAPMRVRVMPGRHTVEAADSRGRYRRAGWVDVTAGTLAQLKILPEPPPTLGVDQRRRQLRAGIDRARVDECTRKLRKQGISGTHVTIELGVDAQGAINYLNILDTDIGQATARCVGDVLRSVTFKPGPAAQWRERIDL
jgi:hypothetical protein